jgi:hypothetical protein
MSIFNYVACTRELIKVRGLQLVFPNMLLLLWLEVGIPAPNPKVENHHFDCPQLLIQYICICPSYLGG